MVVFWCRYILNKSEQQSTPAMESEGMLYFKCTSCSECFMTEDVFFAHSRTWHCKVLISEGQDPNNSQEAFNDSNIDFDVKNEEEFSPENYPDDAIEVSYNSGAMSTQDFTVPKFDMSLSELAEHACMENDGNVILSDDKDTDIKSSDVNFVVPRPVSTVNPDASSQSERILCDSTRNAGQDDVTDAKNSVSTNEHLLSVSSRMSSLTTSRVRANQQRSNLRMALVRRAANNSSVVRISQGDMSSRRVTVTSYCCSWCGRLFRNTGDLKRHELCHTGERPFECDVCHRRFRRSHHLKGHKFALHNAT